jgi:dihydroorotate dehydrogenase electron transfer subunit
MSNYRVVECAPIAERVFSLVFDAPDVAYSVAPGQFVHVKCGDALLLRRPISVCDTDGTLVKLVFEVKGGGTEWLSRRKRGDELDVLGPLGSGFPETDKKVLLIGGGIGTAPLLLAARKLGKNCDAVLGFSSLGKAILLPEFASSCNSLKIYSDDGSIGAKGFVTDFFSSEHPTPNAELIFACGPKPMLRRIAELSPLPVYVSMEERMGCGIGTCLTCVCKTSGGYSRVCKDGPVFEGDSIEWQ